MLVLLRFGLRVRPHDVLAAIGLAACSAAVGVLLTYFTGQVVGAVPAFVGGGSTRLLLSLAGLGACFLAAAAMPVAFDALRDGLRLRIDADVTHEICELFLAPLPITHLEDPAVADLRERAQGRDGLGVSAGVVFSLSLLRSRLTVLGSAALVGALFDWWIAAVLVLATRLAESLVGRSVDREFDAWSMQTEGHRRAGYLFRLGMGEAPKELRIFGLAPWLVGQYVEHWMGAILPMWRTRRGETAKMCVTLAGHVAVHAFAVQIASSRCESWPADPVCVG